VKLGHGSISLVSDRGTAWLSPDGEARGDGGWLTDIDGRSFFDPMRARGPVILDHRHPVAKPSI
jgi:glutamate-1-semialdehyde aminotransferase